MDEGRPILFLAWFSSLGSLVDKERAKGGACSVAQDCTMPHLACSDCALREEVRVVESCQVLQEPRLGIPRPWESVWVWTLRLGRWGFSICPSRVAWEFLHSLLCLWRLTSMNSGCTVQPMGGPCQGSLKTGELRHLPLGQAMGCLWLCSSSVGQKSLDPCSSLVPTGHCKTSPIRMLGK